MDGDHAIIGAELADQTISNTQTGAAYLFYRNLGGPEFWGQQVKIFSPNLQINAYFGFAATISGDHAFVGSPNFNSSQGIAFHYIRNLGGPDLWGFSNNVTQSNPQPSDNAGSALALTGQFAALGIYGANGFRGSALLLQLSSDGSELAPIAVLDDPAPVVASDYFGVSMSLDSQLCCIGAWGKNAQAGAAFSLVLPPPGPAAPPIGPNTSPLVLLLVIIGGAVIVVGVSASVVFALFKSRSESSSVPTGASTSSLSSSMLEFSPKGDMSFTDLRSTGGQNNKKKNIETASVMSGESQVRQIPLSPDMQSNFSLGLTPGKTSSQSSRSKTG